MTRTTLRTDTYGALLARRVRASGEAGREVAPESIHASLKPFQRHIVQWAVTGGQRAVWADTGLGKTRMQIEWARLSAPTALIAAPLAVCQQTVAEAAKIGVEARYIRSAAKTTARRHDRTQHPYPCDCGYYHLGHSYGSDRQWHREFHGRKDPSERRP